MPTTKLLVKRINPLFTAAALLFASMTAIAVSPDDIRQPESYGNTFVSDTSDIIDPTNEKELDDALVKYYKATGIQVAVVTTPDTDGTDSPRTFANELFEILELGDPELDNGLLMLLSVGDRRIEFETGYGLEGLLPDVTQYRIQQKDMIPYFKEGDYQQGLLEGTYATLIELSNATKREAAMAATTPQPLMNSKEAAPYENSNDALFWFGMFCVLIMILVLLFFIIRISSKSSTMARQLKASEDHYEKQTRLFEKLESEQKQIGKRLRCIYCHEFSINPDSPFQSTYTTPDKENRHESNHTSFYERVMVNHGVASIKLKECPKCRHTNKITTFIKPLMYCPICLENSRYHLLEHEFLLANALNTYVDTIDRTQPMEKLVFKSVKTNWPTVAKTSIKVSHCFLCDMIVDEISKSHIEVQPPKPKPEPEPRHVSTTDFSTSSRRSSTTSSRSSSKTSSYGSSSSSSRRSASSSSRSKPTPRRRGGKSGGGGAGSSW